MLGKKPAIQDPKQRTLLLSDYLKLPEIPQSTNWGATVARWPLYENDTISCCTCATNGHLVLEWTTNTRKPSTPTLAEILAAYSRVSGYDPKAQLRNGTNPTDNGAFALDVLKDFRTHGLGNHKIEMFMQAEKSNIEMVEAAIYLFGGVYCGFLLPKYVEDYKPGQVWKVEKKRGKDAKGSWGGHAVAGVSYDRAKRLFGIITWGKYQPVTYDFFLKYADECFVLLSPDDWTKDGRTPSNLDLEAARQQLALVTA